MRKILIYLILLSIPLFLEAKPRLIYAGSILETVQKHDPDCPYANPSLGLEKEKELEEAEKEEKEEIEYYEKQARLIYEKLAKRTKEYRDALDGFFFTVNSHACKAIEAKDVKSEKEFIAILSDYNSVLGDLGLMQVMLDLGKFAEGEKFMKYYDLMESGYERLKDSFSLKNEVFLNRIDKLKNQDALRYEKKLLAGYKDYFEYDPRIDNIEEVKDEEYQKQWIDKIEEVKDGVSQKQQ